MGAVRSELPFVQVDDQDSVLIHELAKVEIHRRGHKHSVQARVCQERAHLALNGGDGLLSSYRERPAVPPSIPATIA